MGAADAALLHAAAFPPAALMSAVRNVRRSPDLTLDKVLALARIFG